MSEPRLIRGYLDVLSARLPASIVDELADGLAETYQSYLRRGLSSGAAAETAVAEFGEPHVIVAGFVRVNPARRIARRLLGTGPAVGACWAAALITSRAWTWPVPLPVRVVVGLALITVISLLATAALGARYRLAARTGAAGYIGTTVVDIMMITGVVLAAPSVTWVMAGAVAASVTRIAVNALAVRPLLSE